jgi:hypothetical protein
MDVQSERGKIKAGLERVRCECDGAKLRPCLPLERTAETCFVVAEGKDTRESISSLCCCWGLGSDLSFALIIRS